MLIAQRPAGKTSGGRMGVSRRQARAGRGSRAQGLARELREEIGITSSAARPLIRVRHHYPYGEVLLDVWVVRRYRGEPRGLGWPGAALVLAGELPAARSTAGGSPDRGALRLPERLRRACTDFYRVGDSCGLRAQHDRLVGVWCSDPGEGARAAAAGADFLVMRETLPASTLASVCEAVAVPVFARGIGLVRAWEVGASGTHTLPTG